MSKFVADIYTALLWYLRTRCTRLVWGWRLGALGHGSMIDRGVEIKNPRGIRIGKGVRIRHGATMMTSGKEGECMSIGDGSYVATRACLDSGGGVLELGSNVYVGPDVYLGGHGGCKVGSDCQIAGFCYIIAANHEFDDRSVPIRLQGHTFQGIEIGEDCWLGNGVTVLDGVTVGRGSVLAARAVVTKDVPEYAVVAGVPARVIRYRGENPE